ncbi:MAG: hypothetical protein NW226_27315 [Microscillaceae bacterium]|nr:hypothetical protein [Microscillaceae bacterium]
MKIKIEIPKIFCNRTTREFGKDEIYYAVMVIASKVENNALVPSSESPLFGKVSEIKKKVEKGLGWRPETNDLIVNIGDAQYFAVILSLYEKDNADIYDELKKGYTQIVKPEKFNWKESMDLTVKTLAQDINKNKKTDLEDIWDAVTKKSSITPIVIGGLLFELAKKIYKHLRQDDLIGVNTDYFDPSEQGYDLPREYNFRKFRAKYDVMLKVSILEEN